MGGDQKLKDGDEIAEAIEFTNNCDLLFFTNKAQCYKAKAHEFADTKASVLGEYIPAKLQMDEGEVAVKMIATKDYKGIILFGFENGKVAKVPLSAYETKTNRKKLTKAYCEKFDIADIAFAKEDKEFVISASSGRMLLLHSALLNLKTTRNTQGVAVLRLKKGHRLFSIKEYEEGRFSKPSRYRTKSLPALGALPSPDDTSEQLSII